MCVYSSALPLTHYNLFALLLFRIVLVREEIMSIGINRKATL